MARKLTREEIVQRMTDWRNVKALHAAARRTVEKLQVLVAELRAQLRARDARIAELEVMLLDKEAQRKALAAKLWKAKKDGTKAAITRDLAKAAGKPLRSPGAQPGHAAFRRPVPGPAEITDRRVFDLAVCPACKNAVGNEVDKVEKYQEDIDLAPRNKIVRHYTITRHWCPNCQEYVRPVDTPAQHLRRFGPNVMGYILYARYRLRLPLLKIQESLSDLHAFALSEGEIQRQLDEARKSFGEQYELICELIRSAKVVYADESGWRMDGDNWYIWAFVSPEDGAIRYEVNETRGGSVARDALGANQDRIIVSDGYAVYDNLPGSNQQCWVHLLRVAKTKSPTLYGELCALYSQLLLELEKPVEQRDRQQLSDRLAYLQAKDYNCNKRTGKPFRNAPEPLAPEVQARLSRHHDQLLVCLDHTAVLPENNTAERAIRPQVILRKIFGGNRSPTGARTHAVNTSVIATKLAQNKGKGFFETMLPLITEAHAKPKQPPESETATASSAG